MKQCLASCSVVSEQVSPNQILEERSFDQSKYVENLYPCPSFLMKEFVLSQFQLTPVPAQPISAELTAIDQTLAIPDRVGAVPKFPHSILPMQNQTINCVVNNYYSSPEKQSCSWERMVCAL